MTDRQRRVLILGARAPVALDHARRFAAQGWRVLVGDSVGMVLHGLPSTLGVTMEMMIMHGQAVARGAVLRAGKMIGIGTEGIHPPGRVRRVGIGFASAAQRRHRQIIDAGIAQRFGKRVARKLWIAA